VRRLTGNQQLGFEFATEWPLYDLDEKTRVLLAYATKLTDTPAMIEDADIQTLRAAGWDERGIWQATALVSFFNFSGRLEAAAGLPPDEVPATARPKEATLDGRSALRLTRKGE
jgi:alkylhydroperoxidase family enzyme